MPLNLELEELLPRVWLIVFILILITSDREYSITLGRSMNAHKIQFFAFTWQLRFFSMKRFKWCHACYAKVLFFRSHKKNKSPPSKCCILKFWFNLDHLCIWIPVEGYFVGVNLSLLSPFYALCISPIRTHLLK